MPHWGPVSRRKLVRTPHELGSSGPFPGAKHEYMIRGDVAVTIPDPHEGDIGLPLLKRVLGEAGISRHEWESV